MANNNYSSVLKEKKKYVEEEIIDDRIFLRRHALGIDFLIILIILIISFTIYYFTELNSYSIIKTDLSRIYDKFNKIVINIIPDYEIDNDLHIFGNGEINIESDYKNKELLNYLNDYKLEYSLVSNDNIQLDLNYKDNKYTYNKVNLNQYINTKDYKLKLNDLKTNTSFKSSKKIKEIIKNSFIEEINNLKLKRKMYILDEKIIVEVSANINGNTINSIYSNIINNLENDSECNELINMINKEFLNKKSIVSNNSNYSITLKNDLINNNIIELNLIIRDKDNDKRKVINYKDSIISYSDDDNNKYTLKLSFKDNSFEVRINKSDELYSVLSGSGSESGYVYNYQVIDVVDKYSLQIKKSNSYDYTFTRLKKNENSNINLLINLTINKDDKYEILNDFKDYTQDYSKLSDVDKDKIKLLNYQVYDYLKELYEYYK